MFAFYSLYLLYCLDDSPARKCVVYERAQQQSGSDGER